MADTIKEQIIDNVESLLNTVTAANGATYTITDVYRHIQIDDIKEVEHPAICFWVDTTPTNDTGVNGSDMDTAAEVEKTLIIKIQASVTDNANPDQALTFVSADIEKALFITSGSIDMDKLQHNNLAIDSNITGTTVIYADIDTPDVMTGYVEIDYEVVFRHTYGDPYNQI